MVLLVPLCCVFGKEFLFNACAMEIMSGIPKRTFLD